jgi:hypothetical protein
MPLKEGLCKEGQLFFSCFELMLMTIENLI